MTFRKLHAFGLGAIFTGIVAGVIVLFAPSRKIAPEPHLPIAERLPDTARAALKTQMHVHARAALQLVSTVTVLDWDGAAAAAAELLAEPRVARPVGNEAADLNARLPDRFFVLQDELRDRVQAVDRAAKARDADGLADAFAATAKTCVHCHDAYLTGR
jgi:hypothetical protein